MRQKDPVYVFFCLLFNYQQRAEQLGEWTEGIVDEILSYSSLPSSQILVDEVLEQYQNKLKIFRDKSSYPRFKNYIEFGMRVFTASNLVGDYDYLDIELSSGVTKENHCLLDWPIICHEREDNHCHCRIPVRCKDLMTKYYNEYPKIYFDELPILFNDEICEETDLNRWIEQVDQMTYTLEKLFKIN